MNNNFGEGEDDLWNEYNNPGTPWERRAEILIDLARLAGVERKFDKEEQYLSTAIDISREHKLQDLEHKALDIIAHRAPRFWNKPELTYSIVAEALALHPDFTPDNKIIERLCSLRCARAMAYMAEERWAEAAFEYQVVLDMASLINDEMEIAHSNYNLCRIYIELDELDKARSHGLEAKKLYQADHQMVYQCNAERQLAKIDILCGNYAKAKIALREIRAIEHRMWGSSHNETKLTLGMAELGLGEFVRAEKIFAKLFEQNTLAWNFAFDFSVQVGQFYLEALQAQGKTAEAEQLAFLISAIDKRAPSATSVDFDSTVAEINVLKAAGDYDSAELVSKNLLNEVSNQGDVRGHYVAVKELIDIHWKKKESSAIVELWDKTSPAALSYQDDLVITVKNYVAHALFKVGRLADAEALINEVLNDYRLGQDQNQYNYAHENAARIYKALAKRSKANKHLNIALEGYLKTSDNNRALELLKYFGKSK